MARTICYTSPSVAYAGDPDNWTFVYIPGHVLPANAKLKFDLLSQGRPIDWDLPSTNTATANCIYLVLPNKKKVVAEKLEDRVTGAIQYEFTIPNKIEAGKELHIKIGSGKKGTASKNCAQRSVFRRRPFHLYVDLKGKGAYGEPEIFTIDVKGNELETIKIITPSLVSKNKRFDITLRFEDKYGNLTSNADEDTLIHLTYDKLRENLNWKLFVPETGYTTLPNLYFNELGTYRIQLTNLLSNDVFYSSPIYCHSGEEHQIYWGLFHGESEKYDSTEQVEQCIRHFRDEESLQFYASSCFESFEETPNETWRSVHQSIQDFNEEERFSTFLGFQWQGTDETEGLRQIIYSKDSKQILRRKEQKYNSLKKIYSLHTPKDILSIPSFTMSSLTPFDFKNHNPEFERVVEIYNSWGSSATTAKKGNSLPIKANKKLGLKEYTQGSVLEALNQNCRFGFVAGGLDDRGAYQNLFDNNQQQYVPGLTAVLSPDQSKDAYWDSVQQRRCYATTGAKIILGYTIAGYNMGSEILLSEKPGLKINRHIAGYVVGTENLEKVELICSGKVIHKFKVDGPSLEIEYDHLESIEKSLIKGNPNPFCYYFIRVEQADGHIAWGSPIWIDSDQKKAKKVPKKK